jgi:hypothetical protein
MKLQIIETPDYILAVSDKEIKEGDLYLDDIHTIRKSITSVKEYWEARKDYKKIIAYLPNGNTPELDLPLLPQLVVKDDVEKLPYDKLCYYDTRNPDFQIKEEYGYDKEEVDATGEFPKKDCACDNCFYGRAKLADRIIKSATRKYSEYDLRKAFEAGMYFIGEDKGSYEEFIQSLKQPKTPKWFVAEMEDKIALDVHTVTGKELKITTINGKTYLVGTYEY